MEHILCFMLKYSLLKEFVDKIELRLNPDNCETFYSSSKHFCNSIKFSTSGKENINSFTSNSMNNCSLSTFWI